MKKFFPRGPIRVVLYIDDLDRCPPNRVVEILEAVQLLLNTQLFIVILGIDDRYIARALEQVYKGVLKRGGKPSGIDYLEKIIQIPYRMRPISPEVVESYLRSQLKVRPPAPVPDQKSQPPINSSKIKAAKLTNTPTNDKDQTDQVVLESNTEVSQTNDSVLSDSVDSATSPSQQNSQHLTIETPSKNPEDLSTEENITKNDPNDQLTQEKSKQNDSTVETSPPDPTPNNASSQPQTATANNSTDYLETIASVIDFEETEFQLLVQCCKYVDITPRTAKRLINIYKILQIIWSTRKALPTEQEKRTVMSFLALSGRYPSYMRSLFEEIDVLLEEKMLDDAQTTTADNPKLEIPLADLLKPEKFLIKEHDLYANREWRKFTSDIKKMLRDSKQPKEQLIQLRIDRATFDLMLSFCFVGDIGYDPDDFQSYETRTSSPDILPVSH